MRKRNLALGLAALLLVSLLTACLPGIFQAEVVYPLYGVVDASPSLQLRPSPSTAEQALRSIPYGTPVVILKEVEGQSIQGDTRWYFIKYNAFKGYVSAVYIKLKNDLPKSPGPVPVDQNFEQHLAEAGFPNDYISALREVHIQHPSWIFTPLHTNYSFKSAVVGEDRPGVNLVPATSPDSFKSVHDYDYDRYTNTWKQYEPGWVAAGREIIAKQMDPRHFLNEVQLFQFENLQYNANYQTEDGVRAILKGTFMEGEQPVHYIDVDGQEQVLPASYLEIFMQAAQVSHVSPYHLASRARQELSPSGSDSSSGNYRDMLGYYNFFNIGAYSGRDPVYNGLITARDGIVGYSAAKNAELLFPWTDPSRAITGGAIFIGQDYINVDQNTLYLQKFNLSSRYTRPFEHQYMGNVFAPEQEANKIYKAYKDMGALDQTKEFIIPVFTGMPSDPISPDEDESGNPNNWLASIKMNGQMIEGFRPDHQDYTVEISTAVQEVKITAEPMAKEARVEGNVGTIKLKRGANVLSIRVIASNGEVRTYSLTVNYGRNLDRDVQVEGKSDLYELLPQGFLYGADPDKGTNTVRQILDHTSFGDSYTAEILGPNGQRISEGPVGTGSVLRLKADKDTVADYRIIIRGDVNGDGSIDLLDANAIFNYVIGKSDLTQDQERACDVNHDGSQDLVDANLILQVVLGKISIEQTP